MLENEAEGTTSSIQERHHAEKRQKCTGGQETPRVVQSGYTAWFRGLQTHAGCEMEPGPRTQRARDSTHQAEKVLLHSEGNEEFWKFYSKEGCGQ